MIDPPYVKKQIFLFPFAGGNCYSYHFLNNYFSAYDLHALELPGRGMRLSERFVSDRAAAVADYLQQVLERRNGAAFALYGHSMGATLGLEVARQLEAKGHRPEVLVVSGNSGPDLEPREQRHLLAKEEFLEELKSMGGMPEDFFKHEELIHHYLPVLRADFKICEEVVPEPPPLSHTPIIALMGHLEEDRSKISNWGRFTQAVFIHQVLKGDHFFIYEHKDIIAQLILKALDKGRRTAFAKTNNDMTLLSRF